MLSRPPHYRLRFVTPSAPKAIKLRANALIAKRRKLGWFAKPSRCQKCRCVPKRMEFHHFDYNKPEQGYWLCHRCHWTAHHRNDFLDGVEIFVAYDRRIMGPHGLMLPAPSATGGERPAPQGVPRG